MRFPAIVAALALLVTACGGKKEVTTDTTAAAPSAVPPAAAATGTDHVIEMVSTSPTSFKFVPDNVTIKAGDQVTFKGVSGTQHDVAFYPDSIPPGAADVLNNAIQDKPQDLATPMINDGQSVTISFAGAPAGIYRFYCIPHQAMGMKGTITVTP
ncbi:MAG: plastocyanin/azurin family copper-binding protein [Gemmatimonadales bacterium]